MSDIDVEIAENGIIIKYKEETMVFSSLEDAQDWLSRNAPKKKIKDGKIEDAITEG